MRNKYKNETVGGLVSPSASKCDYNVILLKTVWLNTMNVHNTLLFY